MIRKKIKRLVFVATILILLCFFYWFVFKEKGSIYSLPIFRLSMRSSYLMPVFSQDSKGIAFIKLWTVRNDGNEKQVAEIWTFDLKGRIGKKTKEIPLENYQELLITKLDYTGRNLVFLKRDYQSSRSFYYFCNLNKGEYYEQSLKGQVLELEKGNKIILEDSGNGKGKSIGILHNDGTLEIIRRVDTKYENINNPKVSGSGEVLLFQIHTDTNGVYQNQLWQYSLKTKKISMIAEDCLNVVPPPGDEFVAYLVPLFRSQKNRKSSERWGLCIKKLNEQCDSNPLMEIFNEDVELYSWSRDGKGILFRKANTLAYYKVEDGETRILLDSKIDGWWGYPLSPYYFSWSPDSKKLAVLTYTFSQDGKFLMERMLLLDLESASKTIVHNQVLMKIQSNTQNWFGFYPHIAWSDSGGYIAFEGRNKKAPGLMEIFIYDVDREQIKNLSKGFLGIFYL